MGSELLIEHYVRTMLDKHLSAGDSAAATDAGDAAEAAATTDDCADDTRVSLDDELTSISRLLEHANADVRRESLRLIGRDVGNLSREILVKILVSLLSDCNLFRSAKLTHVLAFQLAL